MFDGSMESIKISRLVGSIFVLGVMIRKLGDLRKKTHFGNTQYDQ